MSLILGYQQNFWAKAYKKKQPSYLQFDARKKLNQFDYYYLWQVTLFNCTNRLFYWVVSFTDRSEHRIQSILGERNSVFSLWKLSRLHTSHLILADLRSYSSKNSRGRRDCTTCASKDYRVETSVLHFSSSRFILQFFHVLVEVISVVNVFRIGIRKGVKNFNVEVSFIEAQFPQSICHVKSGIIFSARCFIWKSKACRVGSISTS